MSGYRYEINSNYWISDGGSILKYNLIKNGTVVVASDNVEHLKILGRIIVKKIAVERAKDELDREIKLAKSNGAIDHEIEYIMTNVSY